MSIEIKKQGKVKPHTSRLHCIKRAKERYNMDITVEDIKRIEVRIRNQSEAFFLERQSKTRSTWLVRLEGEIAVAIYNNNQKCLSTFLPPHYAKRYLNGNSIWNPQTGRYEEEE